MSVVRNYIDDESNILQDTWSFLIDDTILGTFQPGASEKFQIYGTFIAVPNSSLTDFQKEEFDLQR